MYSRNGTERRQSIERLCLPYLAQQLAVDLLQLVVERLLGGVVRLVGLVVAVRHVVGRVAARVGVAGAVRRRVGQHAAHLGKEGKH